MVVVVQGHRKYFQHALGQYPKFKSIIKRIVLADPKNEIRQHLWRYQTDSVLHRDASPTEIL